VSVRERRRLARVGLGEGNGPAVTRPRERRAGPDLRGKKSEEF